MTQIGLGMFNKLKQYVPKTTYTNDDDDAVMNTLGHKYDTYHEYRVAITNIYSRIWISLKKSYTDNFTWHYIEWNYEHLSID